jgi:mannose-1-phosphate guanylyltransferase
LKALLLAGGLGTRLRPLTYTRPKHLLPIANRPHIDHVLDLLQGHGVDEVVLTTSYLADAFRDTIASAGARGMRVQVTYETEPLGTAGAIKHAAATLGDETFLAFNADVLTDVDIGRLVKLHQERGARATLLLTPVEDPSAYGVVPTDENGLVRGFIEKPPREEAPTDLINAGVYVMEPEILHRVPQGAVWSAEHQLFPELVEAGEMYAFHLDAYWMDIGTPAKYLQANMDAVDGRYVSAVLPASADEASSEIGVQPGVDHLGSLVATGDEIAPGARIESSVIGAQCRIEDDVVVSGSVLLPRVHVGRGARIQGCVLGEAARVEGGADIKGRTVGDGELVAMERGTS